MVVQLQAPCAHLTRRTFTNYKFTAKELTKQLLIFAKEKRPLDRYISHKFIKGSWELHNVHMLNDSLAWVLFATFGVPTTQRSINSRAFTYGSDYIRCHKCFRKQCLISVKRLWSGHTFCCKICLEALLRSTLCSSTVTMDMIVAYLHLFPAAPVVHFFFSFFSFVWVIGFIAN